MRINLARYNCTHFHIVSSFKVPKEEGAELRGSLQNMSTHTHEGPDGDWAVFFGSKSQVEGITHQIIGSIHQTTNDQEDDDTVRFRFLIDRASEDLPRPPSGFRSVSKLIEVSPHLFGHLKASVRCIFEYDRSHEKLSRVQFPIPLIVPAAGDGVTHIESAQFSRRTSHGTEYKIAVTPPADDGAYVHSVRFETECQLNWKSIRNLLNRAKSISLNLFDFTQGE